MSNTSDFRFERKFLIDHMKKQEIEMFIKMNPARFSPLFQPRSINNVYLDTHDLSSYYDNIEGNTNRVKVRIRWYGNLLGKILKPVLEYKLKTGLMGRKKSFVLSEFFLDENTTPQDLQNWILDSDLPQDIKHEIASLKPTLLNSYKRSYYMSFNKTCRITLDSDLKYYRSALIGHRFFQTDSEDDIVIVELKYKERDDPTARNISSDLPFKLSKSSKYVMGMEKVYI